MRVAPKEEESSLQLLTVTIESQIASAVEDDVFFVVVAHVSHTGDVSVDPKKEKNRPQPKVFFALSL